MKNESSDAITFSIPKPSLDKSYVPLLVILLIVAAFLLGMLTTKVSYLEKSSSTVKGVEAPTNTPQANQQGTTQQQPPTITIDRIKALFSNKNITFGDKNSKNLLVEVADPSCPYCQVADGLNPELNRQIGNQFLLETDGGSYVPPVPKMKELVNQGKAAFVWIYTPGHGNGEMGTKAMYCAYEKGRFWPVHDKLMTNDGYNLLNNQVRNDKTKSQDLANFLADVFDLNDMKKCLDSGKYDTKLTEDITLASNLGVRGTPGFFINTTKFAGAYSWKDMQSAVK